MASADWRTFLRSRAPSPARLGERPESSPGNRDRSRSGPAGACPNVAPRTQETLNVALAGIRAEAHSDEAAGNFSRRTHCCEYVARLHLAGRAGASGGNRDSRQIELIQK